MRSFIFACIAVAVIAVVGGVVLNEFQEFLQGGLLDIGSAALTPPRLAFRHTGVDNTEVDPWIRSHVETCSQRAPPEA